MLSHAAWLEEIEDQLQGQEAPPAGQGALFAALLWPVVRSYHPDDPMALAGLLKDIVPGNQVFALAGAIQQWHSNAKDIRALASLLSEVLEQSSAMGEVLKCLKQGLAKRNNRLAETLIAVEQRAGYMESGAQLIGTQHIIKKQEVAQQNNYFIGGMVNEMQEPDARRRYLRNLYRECCTLPLATFRYAGKPEEKQAVSLETVYIDLNTNTRVLDDGRPLPVAGSERMSEEDTRLLTVDEAALRHHHLVLLGEAGSGKSTYIKHNLARLCVRLLENDPDDECLPLLITLRDLAAELETMDIPGGGKARRNALAEAVVGHLKSELKRLWADEFADTLQAKLITGQCVMAYDGLDEVPVQVRGLVRDALTCVQDKYQPARSFITCRIRSYHGDAEFADYPVFQLAPLNEEQIRQFCIGWYGAHTKAGTYTIDLAEKKGIELGESALTLPEMAANPMLLTTLAIVHQQDNRLPHQRVVLYARAVDILLVKWQDHKTGLEAAVSKALADFLMDPERVRSVIESMAFAAHEGGRDNSDRSATADLSRGDALTLLEGFMEGDTGLAREFLDYIDLRAGLFVGRGESKERPAVYSFVHRTFQEYLAGSFLVSREYKAMIRQLKKLSESGDYWSLVVQLGMEELLHNGNNRANILFDIATALCPAKDGIDTLPDYWQALWSGRIAEMLGKEAVVGSEGIFEDGEVFINRIRSKLVLCLGGTLPAIERAEAGLLLGKLGDPRKEVTTLGDMVFCYVSAGPFLMGTALGEFDEAIREDNHWKTIIGWATPKREELLSRPYWIGKQPITQAQYACFVEDMGYENQEYWTEAGWEEKEKEKWARPDDYAEVFHLPNHPVVGVSWYEAYAYTQWLDVYLRRNGLLQQGWRVSLPNEEEWEKAARGGLLIPEDPIFGTLSTGLKIGESEYKSHPDPGQIYSWGNESDEDKINFAETGINRSNTTGCFEGGATRYGAQDMLGNVWEWTVNRWIDKYPDSKKKRLELENEEGESGRVLRGGAFFNLDNFCRCAIRSLNVPNYRDGFGFRIVLRPPA